MRLRKKAMIMAMIMSMAATPIQYAGAQTVSVASVETECESENYGLNYVEEGTLQLDSVADLMMLRNLYKARNNKSFTEVKKLVLGKDVTMKAFDIMNFFPELQEIQVVPENPNFMSKDGVLFDKAGTTLVAYPAKGKTTYVVPEGTEIIGVYAFSETSIKKVEIPKSVDKIRPNAFMNSTLENVKMVDNSVTYIGLYAFSGTKLTSVTLPKGLTKINSGLFADSTLKSVVIPSTVKTIEGFAFRNTKMTTVSIPASVTSIEKEAFIQTKLKEVKLAASNKKYAKYKGAIYNKAKTELVLYPEGYIPAKIEFASTLKNLDIYDFRYIKGNELVIPKGLLTIQNAKYNQFKKVSVASGNKAFVAKGNVLYSKDMKRLLMYPLRSATQNVVLADGLQIINMNVFGFENNNIVTLTLPKSLKRIESYYDYPTVPGSGFTKMTTIKVKSGNKYFTAKDGILYNKNMSKIYWFPINKNIKSYTMPATVTQIRNGSLAIQNHLENLTISANCTSIDQQYLGECGAEYRMYLGMKCPKLKGINFKSTKAGFRSVDGVVYSKNWQTIWYYSPNRKNKEYKIDSRCQYMGNLLNNKYLEKVYLPDNLESDGFLHEDIDLSGFTNAKEFIISDKCKCFKTLDGVLYTKGSTVEMAAYPMGRKNASLLLPADLTNGYIPNAIRKPGYIKSVSMEEGSKNCYIKDNCLYNKDGKIQWDFTEMLG